jgi:hypothetical protein
MAVDDHRYAEDRWSAVLSNVLQSPRHRMRLVRDPERATELWGFCEGGRAFLRVLNALAHRVGEDPIQQGADRFLAAYVRNPEPMNRLAEQLGRTCRLPELPKAIDEIAKGLGYRAGRAVDVKLAIRPRR